MPEAERGFGSVLFAACGPGFGGGFGGCEEAVYAGAFKGKS